jgi:ADP-ribose pyrophosphatase YjhB (NUDIX family)
MSFDPHVTVATVIERDNKYLLIEESSNGRLVYNQPAGHLEADETLQQAALRETLEETGWEVELQGVVGMALYHSPHNGVTYHRSTFYASAINHHPEQELDEGIEGISWMSYEEMLANADNMRSPLVIKAVEQYRNGHRYPLDLIYDS